MVKSIRWRLQLWYAGTLLAVVAGFAGLLYFQARSARLRQIDEELEGSARYLEATLRGLPPQELESADAPPPSEPGRPPRKTRDEMLVELDLPPTFRPPAPPGAPPPPPEPDRPYFIVWRADGTVLKASQPAQANRPPPVAASPRVFDMQRGPNREAILQGPHETRILVGRPMHREFGDLSAFAWQLLGTGCVVLAVGLLGGWLISARVVRPIAKISATASSISAANLSDRIETSDIDAELVGLAEVMNAMFARLGGEFERQARFTADASHELRTPLAVLHSHVELALNRPRSQEEYRDTLRTCLQASGRMRALVDGLLTLARADAGRLDLERKPVDLRSVVEEATAQHRLQAEQAGVALSAEVPGEPVTVSGDRTFLVRVLSNLLANALRHTPAGGTVRARLTVEAGTAMMSVADTGSGIPEEDQPRIFERFYRVDRARSRVSGGCGLGLAICKSLVEAHGGTIGFTSKMDEGSTFMVRLPLGSGATGTG